MIIQRFTIVAIIAFVWGCSSIEERNEPVEQVTAISEKTRKLSLPIKESKPLSPVVNRKGIYWNATDRCLAASNWLEKGLKEVGVFDTMPEQPHTTPNSSTQYWSAPFAYPIFAEYFGKPYYEMSEAAFAELRYSIQSACQIVGDSNPPYRQYLMSPDIAYFMNASTGGYFVTSMIEDRKQIIANSNDLQNRLAQYSDTHFQRLTNKETTKELILLSSFRAPEPPLIGDEEVAKYNKLFIKVRRLLAKEIDKRLLADYHKLKDEIAGVVDTYKARHKIDVFSRYDGREYVLRYLRSDVSTQINKELEEIKKAIQRGERLATTKVIKKIVDGLLVEVENIIHNMEGIDNFASHKKQYLVAKNKVEKAKKLDETDVRLVSLDNKLLAEREKFLYRKRHTFKKQAAKVESISGLNNFVTRIFLSNKELSSGISHTIKAEYDEVNFVTAIHAAYKKREREIEKLCRSHFIDSQGKVGVNNCYWEVVGNYSDNLIRIFSGNADQKKDSGTYFTHIYNSYVHNYEKHCRSHINDPIRYQVRETTKGSWGRPPQIRYYGKRVMERSLYDGYKSYNSTSSVFWYDKVFDQFFEQEKCDSPVMLQLENNLVVHIQALLEPIRKIIRGFVESPMMKKAQKNFSDRMNRGLGR